VNGILYYYAYENYMETRPSVFEEPIDITSDNEDDDPAEVPEPICQVFWQVRIRGLAMAALRASVSRPT
jgi:hypothetical protein